MLRKLLIALALPIVTATGCQTLERVEVWKQQTFFSPAPAAQSGQRRSLRTTSSTGAVHTCCNSVLLAGRSGAKAGGVDNGIHDGRNGD